MDPDPALVDEEPAFDSAASTEAEPTKASTRTATRAIVRAILDEENRLRARHPWLAHQDLLGASILICAVLACVASGGAYLAGNLPAWLAIPLIALPLSILHELEHDLVHNLYFRRRPELQHLAFAVGWLLRMTMNPWTRRLLHLGHHRDSGQPGDVEERLIGLGARSLPLRLLVAFLPLSSALLMPGIARDTGRWFPSGAPHRTLRRWASRFDFVFYLLPFVTIGGALCGVKLAQQVLVIYVAPNLLRHGAIVLMSSYSHYRDIPPREVLYQNQILRHPLLWPLQLFCFNFGATHVIHHFVVNQPFYLRQLVAPVALAALERNGVQRNDAGVIARANRYPFAPVDAERLPINRWRT